jgi:hypothetical protein
MIHTSSNGIWISFSPNSALFIITVEESAVFMDPGMTDIALNPVLFTRGFKIISTTTHTKVVVNFCPKVLKFKCPKVETLALME